MAGFFARLKAGLTKTRGNLTDRVDQLVENTREVDEDFYDELTDILLLADVGVAATEEVIGTLRDRVEKGNVRDANKVREMLKEILIEEMNIPRPPLKWPMVMFVVGVNGVGKTTTIGKMALRFQEFGRSVMLAAADTFRAAADEQLAVWADRAKVPIIRHPEGSDPAAVVYDAVQAAKAKKYRPSDRRYSRPAAQQKKSYGRTVQNAADHRPRIPGSRNALHARAGRNDRAKRYSAGQAV